MFYKIEQHNKVTFYINLMYEILQCQFKFYKHKSLNALKVMVQLLMFLI